jgi:hypothetical protein
MAVSSLRFRIEGENSSALRSITDVRRAAANLGGELQRSIGDKLKGVFSVVAVEEMVRRTGEWAHEIQNSARELNISTRELQAFRLMAERAGVSTDKIFSFYDKIESKATQVRTANDKLARSFAALGVSMKDLKGADRIGSGQILQKMFQGAGPDGGKNSGAVQSILGAKNYRDFAALAREAKGQNFAGVASKNESQMTDPEDISSIAQSFNNIKEDLTAIAKKFEFVAVILLNVVDGVAKMANGILGTLNRFNPFSKGGAASYKGLFGMGKTNKEHEENQLAWEETVLRGATGARAAANFIPGLASIPGQLLGLQKKPWQWVKTGREAYGDALSKEGEREAEGGMEGALTLATLGTGAITKGVGLGARGAGFASEVASGGRMGKGLSAAGRRLWSAEESGVVSQGLLQQPVNYATKKFLSARGFNKYFEKNYNTTVRAANQRLYDEFKMKNGGRIPTTSEAEGIGNAAHRETLKSLEEGWKTTMTEAEGIAPGTAYAAYAKYAGMARTAGAAGTLASAGAVGIRDKGGESGDFPPPDRRSPLNLSGEGYGPSGNGNLAIGGVLGVDVMGRIRDLNAEMVDLLQQIVINTGSEHVGVAEDQTGG